MQLGVLLLLSTAVLGGEPKTIVLDGRREGRTFEGLGALSAGASSRLLIDYPEPSRSQILDFLFKPGFGAAFQHLKVEIGGDVNSTDGCEPSHQHTRGDRDFERGYEWWLMKEAKRRNPDIILDCLEWGAPAWIGNGYFHSQDNADYIAAFIEGARRVHGLRIDYTGVWNETRPDMGWVKLLRRTLDRHGLRQVQIVGVDDINRWTLVDVMKTDPELARAVQVVGVHYPKYKSTPAAQHCGKRIWANEDGPWKGNWTGATALARMYNRNYIEGKMTKTIIWSPITSYYDNLPLPGSGAMRANTPWSGHYEVQPAIWITAHTTQFAQPGWKYLDGEACCLLEGGSLVTLKAPNNRDYSVIIETTEAKSGQNILLQLEGGLSTQPARVWRSRAGEYFSSQPDLTPRDGRLELALEAGCVYSLTTTGGQSKGAAIPPPRAPFPTHYQQDFDHDALGATPRYFSDQAGIFEVARRADGKGRCLRQIIMRKGIEWPFHLNPYPETFLGDVNWRDYTVAIDARIEGEGFVSLFGRVGVIPQNANPPNGYWLKLDQLGNWELGTANTALASGRVPQTRDRWHRIELQFTNSTIRVSLDGRRVCETDDGTYSSGLAGVGSGWHRAEFDSLEIRAGGTDVNLAYGRPVAASSALDVDSTPSSVTDGDPYTTRWTAAEGKTANEWLEVDLGAAVTFNSAVLKQFEDRIGSFKLQCREGEDWRDLYTGKSLGTDGKSIQFAPATARRVRLLVTDAKSPPSIWEFEVRHRP